jgi:hypothetical protein
MSDLSPLPLVLIASDRLARSAMPDAPVIPDRPRRQRRRLRGFAKRLRASRPRPWVTQLEKESPCGT